MSARALGPGAWQHVRRAPARDPLPVVLARGWRRTHPRPDDAAHLAHEAHLVQGVINRAYLTADDRTLFAAMREAERIEARQQARQQATTQAAARDRLQQLRTRALIAGALVIALMVGTAMWPIQTAAVLIVAAAAWLTRLWLIGRTPDEPTVIPQHPVAPMPAPPVADVQRVEATLTPVGEGIAAALGGRRYPAAIASGVIDPPTSVQVHGGIRHIAEMPPGVLASAVSVERVAAALRLPSTRVQRIPGAHDGELVLEIAAAAAIEVGNRWSGPQEGTDWTQPMTVGVDTMGRPLDITLGDRCMLAAGRRGSGKTYGLLRAALHAAGDPRCSLYVIDPNPSGILSVLEPRATRYLDADALAARDGRSQLSALLRAYAAEVSEIKRARLQAGGRPPQRWVILVADELSTLSHAHDQLEQLIRTSRAGHGVQLGADQLPKQGALPSTYLEQFDMMMGGRARSSWAARLLFGDDAPDCTGLDTGHFWLGDGGDEPTRVQVQHIDLDAARAWVQQIADDMPAQPAVEASPWHPTDTHDAGTTADLLASVLAAMGDRSGISWDDLAATLGRDRDTLQASLAALGIRSASVGTGGRDRGVRRTHVEAALAAR